MKHANPKVAALEQFRRSQKWTRNTLYAVTRVLQYLHPIKRRTASAIQSGMQAAYIHLVDRAGREECSICKKSPPEVRLQIATKKGQYITQKLKINQLRLLCRKCAADYTNQ
ncbi:MAG: hypothetical protein ACYC09_13965 [Bacteroidota bacterium]